ncbi:MAG TPA: DUF5652 family protein [Patescibacteria group bacterium]|nr:DUF5652 family protein [Patescibacteria group bacterium]
MMGYNNYYWGHSMFGTGMFNAWVGVFLVPLLIWSLFWKGWALWNAARREDKVWFVALLLLNTAGILDILYIFVFGKTKTSSKKRGK